MDLDSGLCRSPPTSSHIPSPTGPVPCRLQNPSASHPPHCHLLLSGPSTPIWRRAVASHCSPFLPFPLCRQGDLKTMHHLTTSLQQQRLQRPGAAQRTKSQASAWTWSLSLFSLSKGSPGLGPHSCLFREHLLSTSTHPLRPSSLLPVP